MTTRMPPSLEGLQKMVKDETISVAQVLAGSLDGVESRIGPRASLLVAVDLGYWLISWAMLQMDEQRREKVRELMLGLMDELAHETTEKEEE